MIIWRNVLFTQVVLAWLHGFAAAILHTMGMTNVGGFFTIVAVLLALALIPVAIATSDQSDNLAIKQRDEAQVEAKRLRAQLAERELQEPLR